MPDIAASATGPRQCAVHQALVRPLLSLGVERHVIALEATLGAALLFAARPSMLSLGTIAILLFAVHPTLAWLTAKESMVTELYLRNASYAHYYAPQPAIHGQGRSPHPSVPRFS